MERAGEDEAIVPSAAPMDPVPGGGPESGPPYGPLGRSVEPLHVQLRAQAAGVGRLRRAVRPWLDAVGVDADTVEDLLLAVSEAVENAVDHAFVDRARGTVTVHAQYEPPTASATSTTPAAVVLSVVDDGRWRAPTDPGYRGRGLALIAQLCGSHVLEPGPTGTRVTMRHLL